MLLSSLIADQSRNPGGKRRTILYSLVGVPVEWTEDDIKVNINVLLLNSDLEHVNHIMVISFMFLWKLIVHLHTVCIASMSLMYVAFYVPCLQDIRASNVLTIYLSLCNSN